MAGGAGTPLHQRLGLAPGMRVGLDDPPPEFVGLTLLPVPDGVSLHTRIAGNMDVVMGFYERRRDYEGRIGVLRRRIDDDGAIWICWPGRLPSDLSAAVVLEVAAGLGLVDGGTCEVDGMWTGQRLVVEG